MVSEDRRDDQIKFDFEQAKAKHLLFKTRLRSLLYGASIDETPVVSQYECTVGKWIYGHAINAYAHIKEMYHLEEVHASLHILAKELVEKFKEGKSEEAKQGLESIEQIAEELVSLLTTIESKVQEDPSTIQLADFTSNDLTLTFQELKEMQRLNEDLDRRIREQSKELYEAKERFELVAKATQDAVWDWNLLTNHIWWNDAFKELFGHDEKQMAASSESWFNNIHPDDRERVINDIRMVIDHGGKKWSAEYRFRKANSSYAIVYDRGYAVHDKEGKPYRMVGSMSDITERKKAEEELFKTNKRLQMALEAGQLGSYELDIVSGAIKCNAQCKANFGIEPDGKLNFSILLQLILHEDRTMMQEAVQQALVNNSVYNAEYRVLWPDDTIHWVQASGLPVYNEGGEPIQLTGVTIDITKQKLFEQQLSDKVNERTKDLAHANERLLRSNKELARSNTNLEEFAFAASHDMKEPIRKIEFFADRIQTNLGDKFTTEERLYFGKMEEAARRMRSLIDDLLSYSQVSIRPTKLSQVNLNDVVELVIEILEVEIAEKQAQITIPPLPTIKGHQRQIQQLFQNLISNALKFSLPDCAPIISITSRQVRGQSIPFQLSTEEIEKDYYEIKVIDKGIGFNQSDAERIFNVFTRLHGNIEYRGTGVGLSIVRKVTENHNGFVTAFSHPGEGAVFVIYLPLES